MGDAEAVEAGGGEGVVDFFAREAGLAGAVVEGDDAVGEGGDFFRGDFGFGRAGGRGVGGLGDLFGFFELLQDRFEFLALEGAEEFAGVLAVVGRFRGAGVTKRKFQRGDPGCVELRGALIV